jgi:topoisomerase IA-like protein
MQTVQQETDFRVDPKTGKNVHARIGRFGAMIQIGETDDEKNQSSLH